MEVGNRTNIAEPAKFKVDIAVSNATAFKISIIPTNTTMAQAMLNFNIRVSDPMALPTYSNYGCNGENQIIPHFNIKVTEQEREGHADTG